MHPGARAREDIVSGSRRRRRAGGGGNGGISLKISDGYPKFAPDKADRVRELQELLGCWGFELPVNGRFGPLTESAVIAFQKAKGLGAGGVVGPETWKALHDENQVNVANGWS